MPGKIHVPVTVATDGFDKIQRAFGRLKGVALGVTAAIAGLGAAAKAIDFTGSAIQGARDLERNYAGLESVFKDATQQMKDFGASASEMGLSMNEAAKATTFIGSVLKQSGFSIAQTADLTEELVELGADLALTYGYDVQEALLGMTALFRGEYDPIEKFGVAMKQSEIDAEKAARGLDGLTGAAERFADQQIRVEFLMERAGDAMGAFERQSGNLTVQQMRLRAEFENVRDTVADDLLPPLAEFTGGLREITERVGPDLEDVFDDLAPVLDNFGQQLLPLLQAGIEGVIEFASQLIEFLNEAQDPSTELGESFQDLGTAISNLIGDADLPSIEQQFDTFTSAIVALNDGLTNLIETIAEFKDDFKELRQTFDDIDEALNLPEDRAGTIAAIAASVALLATNMKTLQRVASKVPKGGLIAAILFGTALGGGAQQKAIEDAREDVDELGNSLTNLYDNAQMQGIFGGDSFAYLEAQTIKFMEAQGLLTDEYLRQNPEVRKLAEQYGILERTIFDATNAANNIQFDGAKAKLFDFNESLEITAEATRELERAMYALDIASGKIGGSGSSAGEVPVQIDLDNFRKQLGLDEEVIGNAATDYVAEFFDGIKEGIEKEAARLDLEELGLSAALIDQILGSQGWEELFQTIVDGGADMARALQDDFNQTAKGIDELAKAAEELAAEQLRITEEIDSITQQMIDAQEDHKASLKEARAEFDRFTNSLDLTVDGLKTYERQIGQFESQTRNDLQRIESQINSAFDNGYLLVNARDNLLEYARAEFNVLLQIQQQRDDLLSRRNAAADVIFGVASAVTAAGNITSLLRDVQDEVKEVQVSEVFEDVVRSADGLNGFRVTLERNYTDVITDTVNKSQSLVNGFQAVIDRTRAFIDNLQELRKLGLDPFLFNQLVDAGAEAGGATAQALVEGGADTVNQVNALQAELEAMGVELGEQSYEVTKNSGEQFVSGIVDGLDAKLEDLEETAMRVAASFSQTFATAMSAGMDIAFDQIKSELEALFDALMAELEAKLAAMRAALERQAGYTSPVTVEREGGGASTAVFDPITGELLRSYTDTTGALLKDGMVNPDYFADYPALSPEPSKAGTTFINNIVVSASSRSQGQQAGQEVVNALKTYQSSNGSIDVALTGFGS